MQYSVAEQIFSCFVFMSTQGNNHFYTNTDKIAENLLQSILVMHYQVLSYATKLQDFTCLTFSMDLSSVVSNCSKGTEEDMVSVKLFFF